MKESTTKRFITLKTFESNALSKEESIKVGGGFFFRMLDDIRCSLDRGVFGGRGGRGGGNGDGAW